MGQFDAIADLAAQKLAKATAAEQGGSAVAAEKTGGANPPANEQRNPSGPAQQVMGLKETDVAPGQASAGINAASAMQPGAEPATAAGLRAHPQDPSTPLEMEAAKLIPAPGAPVPTVTPPTAQVTQTPAVPAKNPEVAGAGVVAAQADQAKAAGPIPGAATAPQEPSPMKTASAQPGFWDKLIGAAKDTGRTLFELLGDFTAGYSHQQSSPTQDRLAREQQLRLQGNAAQTQKDLQQMQQGFQDAQNKLQREHEDALAKITDDRERAIAKQNFDIQERQLKIEQERNYLSYQLEGLTRMFGYGQAGAALNQPEAIDRQFTGGGR